MSVITSATTSSARGHGWPRTRSLTRGRRTPDLDVVQTGAWILPDERPLPAALEAFLDAGAPPVYVGFGSMPMRDSPDVADVAIEAIRAHGRRSVRGSRLGRPGPDRRRRRLLRRRRGQPAGTVRPGGRRGAPWRRGHDDDGRQGRRTSSGGPADRRTSRTGRAGWPSWASVRRTTVRHRRSSRFRPRSRRRYAAETRARADRRGRHDPHRRGEGRRQTCT